MGNWTDRRTPLSRDAGVGRRPGVEGPRAARSETNWPGGRVLTGIILAGGLSTRFGSDKASALLAGRPLLAWVADALGQVCGEVVVVRARGQVPPAFECAVPVRVVEDVFEAKGPLAGMVAGFEAVKDGVALVVSCDAPLVRPAVLTGLVEELDERDAACGSVGGRLQTLPGAYNVARCLPVARRRVEAGMLSVTGLLDELDTRLIDEDALRAWDSELLSYRGANTPEELVALNGLLAQGADSRPNVHRELG